jgi:hypothetical protein
MNAVRMELSRRQRLAWVWLLTIATLVAVAVLPPLAQPQEYHRFADQRVVLGIANFFDTVSSVAFLIVGAWGLIFVWQDRKSRHPAAFAEPSERRFYAILFGAVVLACFGSVYYHLAPDNGRLAWDRLPIAVGFASLFAATIAERVSMRAGLRLLPALLALGAGSVLYWRWTELYATENLWPYVAVQFYSAAAIVLIIVLFPSRYTRGTDVLGAVGLYALAKIAESLDQEIYALGNIVGGHALKHVIAAIAIYWILRMLQKRRPAVAAVRADTVATYR